MATLRLDANQETEDLLQYVTKELDDATLDSIEVQRELGQTSGLASEPLTLAATVTLSVTGIAGVVRLVERWMEHRNQQAALRIVAEGFDKSTEAGKALAQLAAKHAKVSIQYGLVKEPWKAK